MSNVPKIQISPEGPMLSNLIQGYWRLGEWKLSSQQCLSFIKNHLDRGITTVDHAHIYGTPSCEGLFGNALKLEPSLRQDIEIVSKCGIYQALPGKVAHYDLSKKAILSSVEKSLKRLGTDYLDILLIHRPDFIMDADAVASAFHTLKKEGRVKYFGVSNFNSAQLSLLQSRLDDQLITNQIEINPTNLDVFDDGILETLQELRIRPMAWSCLGGGGIFTEQSERMQNLRNVLNDLTEELGAKSIDQTIYAWIMKMPTNPLPILGSGNVDRIKIAVDSIILSMNNEQWYKIWSASKGQAVP